MTDTMVMDLRAFPDSQINQGQLFGSSDPEVFRLHPQPLSKTKTDVLGPLKHFDQSSGFNLSREAGNSAPIAEWLEAWDEVQSAGLWQDSVVPEWVKIASRSSAGLREWADPKTCL